MSIQTDIALLFGFFFIFFAGWILGNKNIKRKQEKYQESCANSYAKGLNYLLANESDKAIQLFIDLIKVDGETVETHLALGKLFRSKGEVDRAIKIHLNILAKPSLNNNQRINTLFELGNDYLKAGLLDRAENVYKELIDLDPKNTTALLDLQNLYISQKSWIQAVACAENLKALHYQDHQLILTHCYCELAEDQIYKKNFNLAKKYLDIAIENDPMCVRALIQKLKLELAEKKKQQAFESIHNLMHDHGQKIDLFIKSIEEYFRDYSTLDEYIKFLMKYNTENPNSFIDLVILQVYMKSHQSEQAKQYLARVIDNHSDMKFYEYILDSFPLELTSEKAIINLKNCITENIQSSFIYQCTSCGYGSSIMKWQCPSCHTWSSMMRKN